MKTTRSRTKLFSLLIVCALHLVPGATAVADDAAEPTAGSPLDRARSAFDRGQTAYAGGDFDGAAAAFLEAYEARPFAQFLYNAGAAFHMKGKKQSDAAAYTQAVDYYNRYLTEEPNATDHDKVKRTIEVLRKEIQTLKAATGDASAPPPTPSAAVEALGNVVVPSMVVIEANPSPATIYLDDKGKGVFARTPWAGAMTGTHTLIIEARGYDAKEITVTPDPTKLVVHNVDLAKSNFLGWLEVSANVPGAEVFIDDKARGAIGRTPYQSNITPGPHTVWVTAEGYDEYQEIIDVAKGGTHAVKATLKGAPVGYLSFSGDGIQHSRILVDGEVACKRGPCRIPAREGFHTISVTRDDRKTYSRRIEVIAKTETTLKVALAPTPSRKDAIFMYIVAAAAAGGGVYAFMQANDLRDELDAERSAGNPPADDDSRIDKEKYFRYGAYAGFGISGIALLTAVYYTIRDKGAPSRATVDSKALSGRFDVQPQVSPGYGGVGVAMRW